MQQYKRLGYWQYRQSHTGWLKKVSCILRWTFQQIGKIKKKFFNVTLSRKFAIKRSLQIPPHLNGVATLPFEILMSVNVAYTRAYMLRHCFLKYKLARDMTYGRQQLLWQKQITVIGSIDLDSHIEQYHTGVAQFQHVVCHRCTDRRHVPLSFFVAGVGHSVTFFGAAHVITFLLLNWMKITMF